jgi:A/G-specific adenine glycosylase
MPADRRIERIRERYRAGGLTPGVVRSFRALVHAHHRRHARRFPWRETHDPYRILVSEFMLQQTGTARVERKYGPFIRRFPNIASLALASERSVLAAWQGLGYNRRALALHRTARAVMNEHGGLIPEAPDALMLLPGVGQSTAGAVAAFAFGHPATFVETNIRRVYLHVFFPGREGVRDSDVLPLVRRTVDRKDPRTWYYALMDLGAALAARVPNPNRRSAHHSRQTRFEGSRRQLRGRALRALIEHGGGITLSRLARTLAVPKERLEEVLDGLHDEGFLARDRGRWRIAHTPS